MLSAESDEREKGISGLSGENPWLVPFTQGSPSMRSCVFPSQLQFASLQSSPTGMQVHLPIPPYLLFPLLNIFALFPALWGKFRLGLARRDQC